MESGVLHRHRCTICWSLWECQDSECGEGIIETQSDEQFLADCGIEQHELSRDCDDCLSDHEIMAIVRAPDLDYEQTL
jgi:hypothetical protein